MPDLIRHPEVESLDSYEGWNPGLIITCHPSPHFLYSFAIIKIQKSFEFKRLIETSAFPLFVHKIGVGNSLLDYSGRKIEKDLT